MGMLRRLIDSPPAEGQDSGGAMIFAGSDQSLATGLEEA